MRESKHKLCPKYLGKEAPEHLEEGVADEEGGEDPADLGAGPAEAVRVLRASPGVCAVVGVSAGALGAVITPGHGHDGDAHVDPEHVVGHEPREDEEA